MILHIMVLDKFLPPFINFISDNFNVKEHKFIFLGKKENKYGIEEVESLVEWIDSKLKVVKLEKWMYKADKIILHGLWNEYLIKLLYLQPWLLKKSYWVMWGGDFYFPEKQSWIKKQVIKNISHFVTYIKGDYELVKQWYGSDGIYHESFMYPSNLYKEYKIEKKNSNIINIQLGNSADPTNNHLELLNKLEKYKKENIKIFTPLSYSGEKKYVDYTIKEGKRLFGDKFIPITEFMSFEKYLEFLSNIDVAIFGHNRQQAMGNIITLLGLGKKVYMRNDITPYKFFSEIGVKVFDIKEINLEKIPQNIQKLNKEKIKEYFSKESYLNQLNNLFRS